MNLKKMVCSILAVIALGTISFTVLADDGDTAAKIGEQTFTSVYEAIKQAKSGDTVEILKDETVESWAQLGLDNVTINGNKHKITIKNIAVAGDYYAFYMINGSTVSELEIDIEGNTSNNGRVFHLVNGTIQNVTVNGGYTAVVIDPASGEHTSVIDGCEFNNQAYNTIETDTSNAHKVTISNNEFNTGRVALFYGSGIEFTGNELNEFGGNKGVTLANGSDVLVSDNIFDEDVRLCIYSGSTATIKNNTIGNIEINPEDAESIAATIGYNDFSPEAEAALKGANVNIIPPVATVGGVNYGSLDRAIEAAGEDGVIELVSDVIVDETVVIDYDLTINGNGFKVKSPNLPGRKPFAPLKVTSGAEVTFEDITVIGGNCADENEVIADGYAASAIEVDGATINVINSELIGGDSTGMSMDSPGSAISAINSSNVSVSDSTLTNGKTNDCPSPVIRIDNTSNLSVHNVVFNFNKSENAYYFNEEVSVIDGTAGNDHTNPVMMSGIISVFGRALDRVAIVIPEGETLQFRGNIDAGYLADEIAVVYEKVEQNPAEDEQSDLYNIVLKSTKNITFTSDYSEPVVTETKRFINRLNSADLTFKLTSDDAMEYEIIASNSDIKINPVNNSDDRYEFHFDGKDDGVVDTASEIIIGQVKVSGYGTYSFTIDGEAVDKAGDKTTFVHATESADSIVETFIPDGDVNAGQGKLVLGDGIVDAYIAVPTRDLTINIDFPNSIEERVIAYNDMTVIVSGGDLADNVVIALGGDAVETAITGNNNKTTAKYLANFVDGAYVVTLTDILTVNTSYNVEVSGAGYRTARYTVTMTEDKTLNFWNNVKDNAINVEEGKDSSAKNVTFLAGDIVKDSTINIYDLSAVVSYFGEVELSETNNKAYAKYDLNRDGKIDSKDVAYVLVSWGK